MKKAIQLIYSLTYSPLAMIACRTQSPGPETRNRKRPAGPVASALCLLAGALVLFSPAPVPAASGTWLQDVSGNWGDSSKWTGGIIATGASSICTGAGKSGGTSTINTELPRTIGGLFMDCNGTGRIYSLNDPTGTNPLTLAGASPRDVIALNGTLELHVVLAGTTAVRFIGQDSGGFPPIYLYAANTYSGHTQIASEGPLRIGIVDAIPHGNGKGNVVLITTGSHGYGTLDLRAFDITINGLSGSGGTVTSSSPAGTSTLTVGDANTNAAFSGVIQNGSTRVVALTKLGSGTQTLSGANTYTGPTTVNAGTLAVNGSLGTNSVVTVSGGTLGGSGTIYGSVIVNAGGNIGAGASVGTLTLYGGLDLSGGGTNIWEIGDNTGASFDQIIVRNGNLAVDDGRLVVRFTGSAVGSDPFWLSSHSWTNILIADSGGNSGPSNFATVVNGTSAAGTFSSAPGANGSIVVTFTPAAAPAPKARITSVVAAPGGASATVFFTNTIAGTNYMLQYRTALNSGSWIDIPPAVLAAGTSASKVDATAVSGNRFYRVQYLSQ